jgi:hypothetical protein
MWIVRVALDRPYTFIVLAVLILVLSPVMISRTPTDIFPNIDIPVIAVAWQYTGMNPEELEGRLTSTYERLLTLVVDNVEHRIDHDQWSSHRQTLPATWRESGHRECPGDWRIPNHPAVPAARDPASNNHQL